MATTTSIAPGTRAGFFGRLMGRFCDICTERAMYRIAPTRKFRRVSKLNQITHWPHPTAKG